MGPHLTATQTALRQMEHSASGAVGLLDTLHQVCRLQVLKGQRAKAQTCVFTVPPESSFPQGCQGAFPSPSSLLNQMRKRILELESLQAATITRALGPLGKQQKRLGTE